MPTPRLKPEVKKILLGKEPNNPEEIVVLPDDFNYFDFHGVCPVCESESFCCYCQEKKRKNDIVTVIRHYKCLDCGFTKKYARIHKINPKSPKRTYRVQLSKDGKFLHLYIYSRLENGLEGTYKIPVEELQRFKVK